MTSEGLAVLFGGSIVAACYFVLWNTSQIVFGAVSGAFISNYLRRRTVRNRALAGRVSSPPLVSVIVPAYNEALTIVESIRALLALDYESREVVVVNDGSTDDTLHVLQQTFHLLAAPVAYAQPLPSRQVRGSYRSMLEPSLVVIDKENGGCKADANNAGINAASGQLVLMVDADTVLEPDGLSRAVLPFLEDPHTVAVGGNVAVANGCRITEGRITDVLMPRSWLARFQIVEYMRSFLLVRSAWASQNATILISGAFGLFSRDALIEIGGYDPTAIGEDIELTLRLHEFCRRQRRPFRIVFDPFPLCSTQVPDDFRSLRDQRSRWRRGLLQSLWRHRRMIGNPRYGFLGVGALPYVAIFEGLGPIIETAGYIVVTVAALTGVLDLPHYIAFLMVSVSFGVAATLCGVLLSDITMRRYMYGRDLVLLVVVALLENVGYRQINAWWACVGTAQALAGKRGWGVVRRRVLRSDEISSPEQQVHRRRPGVLMMVALVLLVPMSASGQDDVLAKARKAAASGSRADALTMLEAHLAEFPRDADAGLLYGLVLSWEGRYNEARPVLQQVLAESPEYTDARVALMNIELWSGNSALALEQAERILAGHPGNVTARTVRDRAEATIRPWWGTVRYALDTYNDETEPWHETYLYVTRRTRVGPIVFRGIYAARGGEDDQMAEVEFYPRFRPGTYAYFNGGVAPDPTLYPSYRVAFDLFHAIGKGYEASVGARYVNFATGTQMYVTTLAKYVGHWMLTGKFYYVVSEDNPHSTSYHGGVRRYYGSDGTSYAGLAYSHGLSKEEIRSVADLARLDTDTVVAEVDHLVGTRLRLFVSGGTGRQERTDASPLWQTTVIGGLSVQFSALR